MNTKQPPMPHTRARSIGLAFAFAATPLAAQGELPGDAAAVRAVVAADFDGDGDPDLVFAIDGAAPRYLRNEGAGKFALVDNALPQEALSARDVTSLDIDGDGDLDLAFACYRAPNAIFQNDGAGSFLARPALTDNSTAWTTCVAAADIDGDGDPDLAFGNLDGKNDLFVNEKARFIHAPQRMVKASGRTACVAFVDFDADGDPDLVCGNRPDMSKQGGADQVFVNDGGKFQDVSRKHMLGRFHTTGIAFADFDADGDLDHVSAHSGARREPGVRNTVHVFKSRYLGGSKKRMPDFAARSNAVAIGDVDGDGDIDALFGNDADNRLYLNRGDAHFDAAPPEQLATFRDRTVDVLLLDVDGNGTLDAIVANDGGPSRVLFGDGRGTFAPRSNAEPVAVADDPPDEPDDPAPTPDAGAFPELADEDEWIAERAAQQLAMRGERGVAKQLLDVVDAEPTNARAQRRGRFALLAIERMGPRASRIAEALAERIDEALIAKNTPVQRAHVGHLLDALGEIAPYAVDEGFELEDCLSGARAAHGDTESFARAWTRAHTAMPNTIEATAALLADDNPFVRELGAELLAAHGRNALEAVPKLRKALGSPQPTTVELPAIAGKEAYTLSIRRRAFVADRVAHALASIEPVLESTLAAHTHRLERAASRWQGPEGAMLRRHATESANTISMLGSRAAETREALESILRPGFPLVLSNAEELALVRATLQAFASLGVVAAASAPAIEPLAELPEIAGPAQAALRSLRGDGKPTAGDDASPGRKLPDLGRVAGGLYGKRARGRESMRSPSAKRAIRDGLEWLAKVQAADGRWDAKQFGGKPNLDVGVTGLALLCFLAEGNTHVSGVDAAVVAAGVRWLMKQADGNRGIIGGAGSNEFIYCHVIAATALVEAYGMTDDEELRPYAQRALDYLERHRNPYGAWRYQPRDGNSDTSVTAWCVNALASGADFGLEVETKAFEHATEWFGRMTAPKSGRVGYTETGGRSARRADNFEKFPREFGEAMTAAAMFGSLRCGNRPDKVTVLQEKLLASSLPTEAPNARDYYYWFWGTHALRQLGGAPWRDWHNALIETLVPLREKKGEHAGSWDPSGVWCDDGGRVFATAMAVLSLQAEYRFDRVIESRWRMRVK